MGYILWPNVMVMNEIFTLMETWKKEYNND